MMWTIICIFAGWYSHAKYGKSNELFVLKLDNAAMVDIRSEKDAQINTLEKRKSEFNDKIDNDCGNGSMLDAIGL